MKTRRRFFGFLLAIPWLSRIGHAKVKQSQVQEVPFELGATLAVGGSAVAHPRRWDQTQDGDEGAYVTDTSETFIVCDAYKIGYNGVAGAKGRCHIHYKSDGTKFGAIVDLEC